MHCWPTGCTPAGCSRRLDTRQARFSMDPSDQPVVRQAGVYRGREVCRALLRQALLDLGAPESTPADTAAQRQRPRQAWLVDRHFADWPLDEPAVLDRLSSWLRPGGCSLVLVGLISTARRARCRALHAGGAIGLIASRCGVRPMACCPLRCAGWWSQEWPGSGSMHRIGGFASSPTRCRFAPCTRRLQTFCNAVSPPGQRPPWACRGLP